MTVVKNIVLSRPHNIEETGVQPAKGEEAQGNIKQHQMDVTEQNHSRGPERLHVHMPQGYISEGGQCRELFYSNHDTGLTCADKHVD